MTILDHPPSTAWERWPASPALRDGLWVWHRPPQAPDAVLVRLPDEAAQRSPVPVALTMRILLAELGLDARAVPQWGIGAATYDSWQGTNPLLDVPLPTTPPGGDPIIMVRVGPQQPPAVEADSAAAALDRIAVDWNACLQLEHQLQLARKQLHDGQARLQTLNRDLTPDERLHADRLDQNEWQDARRWLRDVSSRLSRLIKDHDIGMASAAGRRNWFESVYHQVVAPRRLCEGLDSMRREFEMYRKTLQTMLLQMNHAQTLAMQDGERRAQQVLHRIAARVRAARTRR